MRVLYFNQHFSTGNGKTGIRSYRMAQSLLAHGHQVTMVCGSYAAGSTDLMGPFVKGSRRGVVDGIDVIEFNLVHDNKDSLIARSLIFLKFAFSSVWLALREPYDVAFATTTPLTAGIPGIAARWLRRKSFVFEVRDLWPELPRAMGVITNPLVLYALSCLEWAAYRSAHRCIALSPGIADGIARRGVDRRNITIIPNSCDFDIFQQPGNAAMKRPSGISDTDLMVVYTGTFGVANGLHAVLDAARELKARGREDIKIVLVGDGKLKAELQDTARTHELNQVVFLERMSKQALATLMASADMGIQCLSNVPAFYYGTSPNKFFDYIAAGLPVLVNYPGWVAEMVENEHMGVAVPPENAVAFADALEDAADNRALLAEQGRRSIRLARREFDIKQHATQWVAWVAREPERVH